MPLLFLGDVNATDFVRFRGVHDIVYSHNTDIDFQGFGFWTGAYLLWVNGGWGP
jgi:hypothetical protein